MTNVYYLECVSFDDACLMALILRTYGAQFAKPTGSYGDSWVVVYS